MPVRIGTEQSQLIKVARVVCIIFMMTTHVWPGSDRILAAETWPAQHLFFIIVVDLLGRAAVPLLSLISGLLFVHSVASRGTLSVLRTKPLTLLIPMVFWSVPMVALMFVERKLTGSASGWPETILDWANTLFSITSGPANGPLHFLREIFVMCCYASVILIVYRRSVLMALILMAAIFLIEQQPGGFIMFRSQIVTFFFFGMLLALAGQARWTPGWPLVLVLVLIAVTAYVLDFGAWAQGNHFMTRIAEHVPRIGMSFLMWRISYEIVRIGGRLMASLTFLEPHIFTIFCAHRIVAGFVGGFALYLGWSENDPYYLLLFLVQLPICIAAGYIASRILMPFPWLRGQTARNKVRGTFSG